MASYLSLKKMKRKELEEVSDDFSDFSLSSPARKIRRLDAELPPIMEEEEHDVPLEFEPSLPEMQFESIQEKVDGVPFNAERAIVLFKPVNTPLMRSSSKYSVSVDSDFIFGFKNQFPWSGQSNLRKLKLGAEDEAANAEERDDGGRRRNECLAVVPWVAPSHVPEASGVMEMEGEATSMDMEMEVEVEVNNLNTEQQQKEDELGGGTKGGSSESFHQWQQQQQQQQQHCMTPPQLPQNMSTPITWFR